MLKRKTDVSNALVALLEDSTAPLSVPELLSLLSEKNLHPNKTTVYRILDKLLDQNLVRELRVTAQRSAYEWNAGAHAHLICKACHEVTCLEEGPQVQEILNISGSGKPKGFQVQDMNVYGVCETCVDQ